MTRKVFLVWLALVLTLSVGLVACGAVGEQEEEEEEEEHVGEQEEEEEIYDLTIASTDGGLVVTPGEGTSAYDEGTVVNLVATADACYRFVNWTGDVETIADVSAAATTITMDGVCSITANFEEDAVAFADPNLELAVREAIGTPTGTIYPSDLYWMISLDASQRNITDLTGLECAASLTWLDLGSNQISDISILVNHTGLEYLRLCFNQISDISSLADLTSLTHLVLGDNQISDVSPLAELTALTWLGLGTNQISDVSALADLTNVELLFLDANQVSDISALVNLTSLTTLTLEDNQIGDIEPLVNNPGLSAGDDIYLWSNPLSATSVNTYIPELEARGVTVYY